jgi:uncharacterized membrane protein YfcA
VSTDLLPAMPGLAALVAEVFDARLPWALAAAFAGGLILGFAGFGSGLVLVPLLSLVYGPAEGIAVMMVMATLGGLMLTRGAVAAMNWREAIPMTVAAALVMPLGSWLLLTGDPALLRRGIGAAVVLLALAMRVGTRWSGRRGPAPAVAAGTLSGLVNGAVGLGGVVAGLYILSSRDPAAVQRANIVVVGTAVAALAFGYLAAGGAVGAATLGRAAVLMVPYTFTLWCGAKFFRVTPDSLFRRVALWLVMGIGLSALVL